MVFEQLTAGWKRAIKRAEIRGIEPIQYSVDANDHITVRRYIVESATRDGLRHHVRVMVTTGGVDVSCTGESGMNDHSAPWRCSMASLRRSIG
jgi:hypothetical protein